MDKMLSPKQIMELMSISKRKAYDIIYQMPHIEGPLRVSERALKAWIEQKTVYPAKRRAG
jgi:hypothetical protein